MTYMRADETVKTYDVKPVGVMFSEFYFYLIAFMADDTKAFPTTFRMDRIVSYISTERRFDVPYAKKFSETEFRKRVQFMYGGELRSVRFLYTGVLEAILDRLPTARIEKHTVNGAIIRAEAYGSGIDMWLNSQGDKVKIL
jgi:predicted DNA-binding transcriptional regulator YafY